MSEMQPGSDRSDAEWDGQGASFYGTVYKYRSEMQPAPGRSDAEWGGQGAS